MTYLCSQRSHLADEPAQTFRTLDPATGDQVVRDRKVHVVPNLLVLPQSVGDVVLDPHQQLDSAGDDDREGVFGDRRKILLGLPSQSFGQLVEGAGRAEWRLELRKVLEQAQDVSGVGKLLPFFRG